MTEQLAVGLLSANMIQIKMCKVVEYSEVTHDNVSIYRSSHVVIINIHLLLLLCVQPSLGPQALFILGFERAWYTKVRHLTSFLTSVGVSMETPSFTMTLFQSAYGQVVAWCEYSSSETDGRIAS